MILLKRPLVPKFSSFLAWLFVFPRPHPPPLPSWLFIFPYSLLDASPSRSHRWLFYRWFCHYRAPMLLPPMPLILTLYATYTITKLPCPSILLQPAPVPLAPMPPPSSHAPWCHSFSLRPLHVSLPSSHAPPTSVPPPLLPALVGYLYR